jgi:hypothetical protein
MIENASILRIDVPGAANSAGEVAFTNGASINVRCAIDEIQSTLKWELGAAIALATSLLRVMREDLPSPIRKGYRLSVQVDGEDVQSVVVVYRRTFVMEELSHYELFLKEG